MSQAQTLWFTGIPCSGKSTLARLLEQELTQRGLTVQVLDSDVVRPLISPELGFCREDRDTHISRLALLCELLARHGVITIVAAVSPYRFVRDRVRRSLGKFMEIHVKCPLATAIQRDTRGLYEKAIAGEIKNFTGVSAPYEEPLRPEIMVETDRQTPGESIEYILSRLEEAEFPGSVLTDGYTDEERKQITDQLKDLGYM